MRDTPRIEQPTIRRTVLTLATVAVAISLTACSHAMMTLHGTGVKRPAAAIGHSELRPLRLNPVELRQLEALLRTLSGGVVVGEPAPARQTQ